VSFVVISKGMLSSIQEKVVVEFIEFFRARLSLSGTMRESTFWCLLAPGAEYRRRCLIKKHHFITVGGIVCQN